MPIKHIILALIVAVVWGCNFIFVKLGVQEIPPLFLCALRFFLASVPAIFFVKWPSASFKMVASYGVVMFGLQFSFIFTSLSVGMTAGMASLLSQVQIFFSIFFAAIFLGERPTIWQIFGAIVAFTGIILVVMHLGNSSMTLPGFLLVIAAAISWGLGNLITKKMSCSNMIAVVVWGSFISCFPLLLVSCLIEGPEKILFSLHHFSWIAAISLAYIVYISTWVGYGLWNWLINHHPVASVVPFTLLVPIVGIVSSVFIMGEALQTWKLIASALVIAGLCINIVGPRLLKKKIKIKSPQCELQETIVS